MATRAAVCSLLTILLHARSFLTILRSRTFDHAWYRAFYRDAAGWDPLAHYLAAGASRQYRPCALFDPEWWREQRGYATHDNPLLDYLHAPERWTISPSPYFRVEDGLNPREFSTLSSPLGLYSATRKRHGLRVSPLVDPDHYLARNQDVAAAGIDPVLHYMASGGREGRAPSPVFDAAWYLDRNPDVRSAGWEPLRHFLMRGARQGRTPHRAVDLALLAQRAGPHETVVDVLMRYAAQERHGLAAHTHPRLPPPAAVAPLLDDWPWEPPSPEPPRLIVVVAGSGCLAHERALQALAAGARGSAVRLVVCDESATAVRMWAPQLPCLDLSAHSKSEGTDLIVPLMRAAAAAGPLVDVVVDVPVGHGAVAAVRAAGLAPQDLVSSPAASAAVPRRAAGISVVVPSYRHAAFLDERLATILGQRRLPDEVVVVDDASDDGSAEIALAFADRAPIPVEVVARSSNAGSPFPIWAEGVARTRGDLIWIAESDDVADPRLLERLVPLLELDPAVGLAYCQSAVIGAGGERVADDHLFYTDPVDPRRWEAPYVADGAEEIAAALAIQNTIPNVSAVLFRRTALAPVLPAVVADRYCGDWRAYALIAAAGWRIAFSPEPLNRARRHAGTTTLAGERDPRAEAEAAAVRRMLWSRPDTPPDTIRRGRARHDLEWTARAARYGFRRWSFRNVTISQ